MNKFDELLISTHGVHILVDALFGTHTDRGSLLEFLSLQTLDMALRLSLGIDIIIIFLALI